MTQLRAIEFDEQAGGDDHAVAACARTVLDDSVAAMSATVRAVYCNSVRMTNNPRMRNYGVKQVDGDSIVRRSGMLCTKWDRLAIHLIGLNASPDLYIQAQFDAFDKQNRRDLPHPPVQMLYSDWATQNWYEYSRDRLQRISWQLQSDNTNIVKVMTPFMINLGWNRQSAMRYALLDTLNCVITPLTRYSVAVQEALPEISVNNFRPALLQYLFEATYYDTLLASSLPEQLRVTAHQIRKQLGL